MFSRPPYVLTVKPVEHIDEATKQVPVALADPTTQLIAIAAGSFAVMKLLLDSERKRVDQLIASSDLRSKEIAQALKEIQEQQLTVFRDLLSKRQD
jgi:sugar (pentulose or hexulose) kinase